MTAAELKKIREFKTAATESLIELTRWFFHTMKKEEG